MTDIQEEDVEAVANAVAKKRAFLVCDPAGCRIGIKDYGEGFGCKCRMVARAAITTLMERGWTPPPGDR